MIRFNFPLPADFVITRLINEEQQDEVFVAVHKGVYVCVYVCVCVCVGVCGWVGVGVNCV